MGLGEVKRQWWCGRGIGGSLRGKSAAGLLATLPNSGECCAGCPEASTLLWPGGIAWGSFSPRLMGMSPRSAGMAAAAEPPRAAGRNHTLSKAGPLINPPTDP